MWSHTYGTHSGDGAVARFRDRTDWNPLGSRRTNSGVIGSGEFEAELASAPPGDGGAGGILINPCVPASREVDVKGVW